MILNTFNTVTAHRDIFHIINVQTRTNYVDTSNWRTAVPVNGVHFWFGGWGGWATQQRVSVAGGWEIWPDIPDWGWGSGGDFRVSHWEWPWGNAWARTWSASGYYNWTVTQTFAIPWYNYRLYQNDVTNGIRRSLSIIGVG
jgi:hypothetical protein